LLVSSKPRLRKLIFEGFKALVQSAFEEIGHLPSSDEIMIVDKYYEVSRRYWEIEPATESVILSIYLKDIYVYRKEN
jgi:hypothetical protein